MHDGVEQKCREHAAYRDEKVMVLTPGPIRLKDRYEARRSKYQNCTDSGSRLQFKGGSGANRSFGCIGFVRTRVCHGTLQVGNNGE
jgi:hypothetical protein